MTTLTMRIALMTLMEKMKSRYASTVVLDTDCEVSLFISEVLRVQILLHLTVLEIVMIKPWHQNIGVMSQKNTKPHLDNAVKQEASSPNQTGEWSKLLIATADNVAGTGKSCKIAQKDIDIIREVNPDSISNLTNCWSDDELEGEEYGHQNICVRVQLPDNPNSFNIVSTMLYNQKATWHIVQGKGNL